MIAIKPKEHLIKKIVLAAGLSKRYGKKNKLTEVFNGKPLIKNTIDVLLEIFDPEEILLVLGHQHKKIIKLLNNSKINIIHNINYDKGIGTSISTGIKQLESYIEGVMIIPADMPLLCKDDFKKLELKFLEFNCKKVILPQYNSNIGNPVILPKSYFQILESLNEDYGARSQIKNKDVITVNTGIGTILDVDTEEEFKKAKKYFKS